MYCFTDTCFLCLKNNIKVESVLVEDTDGIVVNDKLRSFFPEIIDSTPDALKLSCLECLGKLRISYDFKQSVINNNTLFRDYIGKLQCEHKRQAILPLNRDFTAKKVENCEEKHNSISLEIKNECVNLTSTNQEQLNTPDQFCQLPSNENVACLTKFNCETNDTNLKMENVETVDPLTETHIKQELIDDDDFSSNNFDGQLINQSYQQTTNENVAIKNSSCQLKETDLKTENIEVVPVPEEIYIKQEPLVEVEDNFKSNNSDEESKESEESKAVSNDIECNNQLQQKSASMRLFACSQCHKTFTRPSLLEKHRRTHSGEKPYECQKCHKRFTLADSLKTHELTHLGKNPYKCSVCHKKFNFKGNLIRHKSSHENFQPSQCPVCNKTCLGTVSLDNHMRTHAGRTCYQCYLCPFKSFDRTGLDRHIRSHTGEKPYECLVCNKTFTQNGSLTRHMRTTHAEVPPYQCTHCKKSFTRLSNLNLHVQKLHTSTTDS